MNERAVTPWEPVTELLGGEFRRESSYANWRPRGSGDWLLIYTVAGSGRFTSPNGFQEVQAGDAALYAPDQPQDYCTSSEAGQWHLLWVHFNPKPHWRPWLRWPMSNPAGIHLLTLESGEVRSHFVSAFRRMLSLSRRQLPCALDLAANALEESLIWANVADSKAPWLKMDERVRKAIDYLTAHLREPFSLGKLAVHCGVSISRLAFLFKKETGETPQQFFERQRMQHARQLLRLTSLNIAEVASEVGYADPFYFSNRFRLSTGKSPSGFRE